MRAPFHLPLIRVVGQLVDLVAQQLGQFVHLQHIKNSRVTSELRNQSRLHC